MSDLLIAGVITLSGSIVKSDDLNAADYAKLKGGDVRVVTIKVRSHTDDSGKTPERNLVGQIVPLFFGKTMISEFGLDPILFEGNLITTTAEDRKAYVTGYINEEGDMEPHKFDRLSPTNSFNMDMIDMFGLGLPTEAIKFMQELRATNIAKEGVTGRAEKFHGLKTTVPVAEELAMLEAKLLNAKGMVRVQIEARIKALAVN